MPKCLWCSEDVADKGDTCNLVCYSHVVEAINLVTYIEEKDAPPKDLYMQPWAAALLNTEEG